MNSVRIVMVLTVVGVISGGLLSVVFGFAEPLIQENRRRATQAAVREVVPGTVSVKNEKIDGLIVFKALGKNGKLLGHAFPSEFSGFQGKIKIMVGMDRQLEKVTGLVVLENIETPGLGNKIVAKSWRDLFVGLSAKTGMRLVKNKVADKEQNEVEAITGATISSQAVLDGANRQIKQVRKAIAGARRAGRIR